MEICDIISRRTDLSTFLVHLTRTQFGRTGKQRLIDILRSQQLIARRPYGHAVAHISSEDDLSSQKVVCFTETPLEYVHLLTRIEKRQVHLEEYGVAIPKMLARKKGVNPVWYLDISQRGVEWLTRPLQRLVEKEVAANTFAKSDIARLTPFIEQMGPTNESMKEFWWEREWRHRGDFELPEHFLVLCPEDDWDEVMRLAKAPPNLKWIDPNWGLEQIIARLAGFTHRDISPFSQPSALSTP